MGTLRFDDGRRRQRERRKRNRFLGKYNNLERAAHFFLYISLPCKTTTDKNAYILC